MRLRAKKNIAKRKPKPNSIPYYIEEVISYRAEHEATDDLKDCYPPVVPELLLSILISVRAIRGAICFATGTFICLAVKLMLKL